MAHTSVVIVSIAMLGTLGGLAYVHATRDEPVHVETRSAAIAPAAKPVRIAPKISSPVEVSKPAEQATTDVSRWIADTRSDDARTRAAAIQALASAPQAQALPALARVLESGDPQIDRQIALRSLHTLALNEGDSEGRIRDTIRHAVYHSDDEAVAQNAQALLEDIEAALDERANSR